MLPSLQTVCNAARQRAIILHGTGAIWRGRAYLFLARSGGGKSTLASLCDLSRVPVLGDDCVLVIESGDGFHIRPLPRQAPLVPHNVAMGEETLLRRAFLLEKADSPCARPISRLRAIGRCLREDAVFGFRAWSASARWQALDRLFRLFRTVPAYVLHFREDNSFWKVIDELEEKEAAERTGV